MGLSSRSLIQLKVMNCKGLQAFNFFHKLSVYAVVSLVAGDDPSKRRQKQQQQQQQRTSKDTQGDKDPEWNQEMQFNLDNTHEEDHDHLFLHFDLRSELALVGDKSIGQVCVLVKDLINVDKQEDSSSSSSSSGIVRFASYEVRTSDNKPNGVLSFSYKVLNQHDGGGGACSAHIDSYPIVNHVNNDHQHQQQHQHQQYNHHNRPDVVQDSSHFPTSSYVHSPSTLPAAEDQYFVPTPSDQSLGYINYSAAVAAPHQIHYPYLETPYPPPATGEGYINYPRLDHDQFYYQPPPPPPPFLPPQLPLLSPPPFPPPPPPHHHHHHHHHQVAEGAVYPPTPWVYDERSYSMQSNYYQGDGTRRC